MENESWKQQETTIAVQGDKSGEWEYSTYPNWDKARLAVNAARREGKVAFVYEGASPPVPPEFLMPQSNQIKTDSEELTME